MRIQYILFDLDGTLTDPYIGITNSVLYAAKKMNLQEKTRESLRVFIGPPLWESFVKYYNLSDSDGDKAVDTYREYFSVKGLFENTPYPNIHQTLHDLKQAGYKLAVATSKPEVYAVQIIDKFDLAPYFDIVCGSELGGRSEDKADVIKKVIAHFNDNDMRHYMMVGDRKHDAIGARKNNMDCIGVTYGYGSYEELQEANCICILKDHQEILEYLKKIA